MRALLANFTIILAQKAGKRSEYVFAFSRVSDPGIYKQIFYCSGYDMSYPTELSSTFITREIETEMTILWKGKAHIETRLNVSQRVRNFHLKSVPNRGGLWEKLCLQNRFEFLYPLDDSDFFRFSLEYICVVYMYVSEMPDYAFPV